MPTTHTPPTRHNHRKGQVGLTAKFYKELVYAVLALASVALVVYEYTAHPDASVRHAIFNFDLVIAVLFLADFVVACYAADDRLQYIRRNWYLLLAAIPITEAWAEVLRALRLFELVRLVRAGEHVSYAWHEVRAVRHR